MSFVWTEYDLIQFQMVFLELTENIDVVTEQNKMYQNTFKNLQKNLDLDISTNLTS